MTVQERIAKNRAMEAKIAPILAFQAALKYNNTIRKADRALRSAFMELAPADQQAMIDLVEDFNRSIEKR
jgi:hypothetical protein